MNSGSFPPRPAPFILSIPNEILRRILAFLADLCHDEPFVKYCSNGKQYRVAQMLVLRPVCRKFRAATVELDFWYDPDFLFANLAIPADDEYFGRQYST
jgi:hypothetical protein